MIQSSGDSSRRRSEQVIDTGVLTRLCVMSRRGERQASVRGDGEQTIMDHVYCRLAIWAAAG